VAHNVVEDGRTVRIDLAEPIKVNEGTVEGFTARLSFRILL
jgi:hypothetical protein